MSTMTDTDTDADLDALDALEPLPPRPRRKLLTPLPLALIAVLLVAVGFIGGVLVQKGSDDASGGGFPGGFPGGGPPSGAAFPGAAAGGGTGQGTTGEVSSKKGNVLYVTTADGTTVKVKIGGATVTRTAEVGANQIHPGDTVVVQGATQDDGTVKATSVTATQAGVSSAPASNASDPVGQLFGG